MKELTNINKRLEKIDMLINSGNVLVYSTNPRVDSVVSLETERARLLHRRRQLEFKLDCRKLESSLPCFEQLSDSEIEAWLDSKDCLHDCPVYSIDMGVAILKEDNGLFLAHTYVCQDRSFVSLAFGVQITPKVAKKLSLRFPVL